VTLPLRLLSWADVKVPPACIYYAASCVWVRRWQGPTPERIAVVIEVKGPWNGELLTSQREQLAKRYGVVSLCASAGWVGADEVS
jgi:hypothetical protein